MLLHMMFSLFLFCGEPKFAGYLNLSKLCVSLILTSPSALVQHSTGLSASLSGADLRLLHSPKHHLISWHDLTNSELSFRKHWWVTGKQTLRAILSRGDLNRPTSTELDVASRWKHGGEFRVQFEHKVFEISGGLSPKYIQHLSVHQTKPRRAEKNNNKLIIEAPTVDILKR